jgi:Macrocin-O-methyltransferase (TylF)
MYQTIMDTPLCDFKDYFKFVPDVVDSIWMEFGVYSGSSIRTIAENTKKVVFGFDCWEGLPESWLDEEGRPRHPKGDFRADRINNLPNNVILVDGLFEDTLPKFCSIINHPVSYIHLDCDLYSSTKTVFNHLKDRFVNNAIIVFDELIGYSGWKQGEYKAWNEFLEETGYNWECLGRHGEFQVGMRIFK